MFLPLLTCVPNDEITSCTETIGKTLSDQKHFILWCVNESSFELFDLSQWLESVESVHQEVCIDLFTN